MGKSAARRAQTEPAPPAAAPTTIIDPAADAAIAESRERNPKPPRTIVHRIDRETGERKWCADVTTDIVTSEWIARKFGAGRFALTHRKSDGGAYQYAGHDTIEIDESVKPDPAPSSAPVPESAPMAPGDGRPGISSGGNTIERAMEAGVLGLLQQMNNQNQLTLAMVERINKADRSGPSMLEIIAAMGPFLGPVLVELVKKKGKDPLETATALATLLKDSNKSPNGDQLATMFERGINLARKFGDTNAGDSSSMVPVIGEGVKMLGGIVEAIVSERRAARGDGPPPLALVPDVDLTPAMTPSSGTDRPWIAVARPHLPSLIAAARWMPAGPAAETIASHLSPMAFDDLIADIEDETPPGFAARLTAIVPAFEHLNPQWFQELITALLEMAGPEEPETSGKPA